jgi:hypothetical protein
MPSTPHSDAAATVREAVSALSSRLSGEFGDLVPSASAERTAALVAKLDAPAGALIHGDDVETLDSWIRLADSVMLHDDPAETQARVEIGRRLRAVRDLVAPHGHHLTSDARDA